MSQPSAEEWVIGVVVPRPLEKIYSYLLPADSVDRVRQGSWVVVPFGKGTTHAFVVEPPRRRSECQLDPSIQLKAVSEIGDMEWAVPEDVWKLAQWAADYYQAPLGEVLGAAVSTASLGLKSAKKEGREVKRRTLGDAQRLDLNDEQKHVVQELSARSRTPGQVTLLQGVTGSGKTEVYLTLAREMLEQGKSVLVLVPEIALTPQLHERFEKGIGAPVAIWHSAVAAGVRRDQYQALLRKEVRVVVGARSSVFAPLPDLGLIVVDEEHDTTYKQEDRVRYQARDLAIVRGKQSGAHVLLGSATPSLESLEKVRQGKFLFSQLTHRATGGTLPSIEIVTLADELLSSETRAAMAERTLEAIQNTINAGQQVIVFLNKRGFASLLVCEDCGEVSECPHCSISLTYHQRPIALKCHVCGYQENAPETCEKCGGYELAPLGAGTESLEEELTQLIQGARVARLDRDQVTSASRLEEILTGFREGQTNLLLGTQMLVKGHDFPGVTLVVVVLADSLFRWPDFRSPERAYQVLTQVAGRAGRGSVPGHVMIQTYQPEHAVLQVLQQQLDPAQFLEQERELRQSIGYPPFARLVRLRFEGKTRDEAQGLADQAARILSQIPVDGLECLGPSEAFLEKAKGVYRWDLILRAKNIALLHPALQKVRSVLPVSIDVDPSNLG